MLCGPAAGARATCFATFGRSLPTLSEFEYGAIQFVVYDKSFPATLLRAPAAVVVMGTI